MHTREARVVNQELYDIFLKSGSYEEIILKLAMCGKSLKDEDVRKHLLECKPFRYALVNDLIVWISEDGDRIDDDTALHDITEIKSNAFYYEKITDFPFMKCKSLKKIGSSAFQFTHIKEVNLPDTVTEIGSRSFADTLMLSKVNLPGSIKTIPACAFIYCENLKSIVFNEGLRSIKTSAFYYAHGFHDTDLYIPDSCLNIESYAFYGAKQLNVSVPAGGYIARDAFDSSCKIRRRS